jgi:hypothetical protein
VTSTAAAGYPSLDAKRRAKMIPARQLRICAALRPRRRILLGFAAAILVGLAGTARTLIIWLWHKFVLLWFVSLFSGNGTRQSIKKIETLDPALTDSFCAGAYESNAGKMRTSRPRSRSTRTAVK